MRSKSLSCMSIKEKGGEFKVKSKLLFLLITTVVIVMVSLLVSSCAPEVAKVTETTEETSAPETEAAKAEPAIPEIPEVKVPWASSPYFDHSYAVIGIEKGFFKDAGITLTPEPAGKVIPADQMPTMLIAKTVDAESVYVPIIFGALKDAPELRAFVYADAFLGFAIMGQPKYKSVEEFVEEGQSVEDAIKNAVLQLKGKTFAYPAETGPKAFIELCFKKGGITLDDTHTVIVEDPKSVEMMISGKVDFQTGGVPSHFTLVKKGFKEIVTNGLLAKYAKPAPDSEELLSIGHAGWGSRQDWIDENPDTMLRMSSVLYRILDLMKQSPNEAFAIHVPYVNSIAGTDFKVEDGPILYKLNNFKTFEEQEPWFLDKNDPFYYSWNLEANAKLWVQKGIWKEGEFNADSVCLADDTYKELLDLKQKSEEAIKKAEDSITVSKNEGKNVETAERLLAQAKNFYDWRNYLDSNSFANASLEWADFGG